MKIKIIKADGTAERNALATLAGRDAAPERDVEDAVRGILEDVRRRGDTAVREYSLRFDGYAPKQPFVSRAEMKAAFESVDETFREAILAAAANIRAYHEKQVSEGYEEKRADGVVLGQMVRGLARVGLYVPGGTAAYPSTVLMNGIPAKLAGVERLVMVTPPRREQDDAILAAAWVAGVDEVVYYGGAQAIAALAYGTESLPRVDKIVGPGNLYVATAKRLIYGLCDIDMIAGPSEILIIADKNANPDWIAADLLSQAEHDENAAAILLTTDEELAERVAGQIEKRGNVLPRRDIAAVSIQRNGLIILCRSVDEMVNLANLAAPEHLEILTEDPLALVPRIRNAGSVFCGPWSPEPLGDYYAGTNHVLPTSGTARFASPLGVYDFIKRMSYTYYTKEALAAAKTHIVAIGEAEGLTAHTEAVKARFA